MTDAPKITKDAWAALAAAHADLADKLAQFGEGARAILLPWLRAAEHLARLLVFLIARTITPGPLRPVMRTKKQSRSTPGFRFALAVRKHLRRNRRSRTRRARARRRLIEDFDPFADHYRDRETEALDRAARRALRAARRPPPPPPPLRPAFPPRPLSERLAALERVLADPDRLARRTARRLKARDPALLLAPRRAITDAPFALSLLQVHDLAWAWRHDTS